MFTQCSYRSVAFLVGSLLLFAPPLPAEPNAQMQKVLTAYKLMSPIPLDKTTPTVARLAPSISTAAKAVMKKDGKEAPPFTGQTEDIKIPTSDGDLAARIYTPAGEGPFPVVLYIHGGGWVLADLDVYDASPRALCEMAKVLVISTDYRKAPEHKFPASHDDTFAAYQWTLENASQHKGDPKKVAVAGESAGGNMAAAICYSAREHNLQMPLHQVLIYPVADTRTDTKSYQENQDTVPLSAKGMKWFFGYELTNPADGENPRIAILRQTEMKGLPPATIIAAEIDPLRSEGKAYADKLRSAGVKVTYKLYPGVTHEFYGMGAVIAEARDAEMLVAQELQKCFNK